MHPEIPNETVHALFSKQLGDRVFARLQRGLGRELDPSLPELLSIGGDNLLFLTCFSVHRNLDRAYDSLIALDLRVHNSKAVPGEFRGRFFRIVRLLVFVLAGVEIDVNSWQRGMDLQLRSRTRKFNRVLRATDGIDDSVQNIVTGVAIYF